MSSHRWPGCSQAAWTTSPWKSNMASCNPLQSFTASWLRCYTGALTWPLEVNPKGQSVCPICYLQTFGTYKAKKNKDKILKTLNLNLFHVLNVVCRVNFSTFLHYLILFCFSVWNFKVSYLVFKSDANILERLRARFYFCYFCQTTANGQYVLKSRTNFPPLYSPPSSLSKGDHI